MKVISLINYKGGVGKTTITSNLAAHLAFKDKKILVIDLDPQTNLTLSLITFDKWRKYDEDKKTIKHWYDQFFDLGEESALDGLIIESTNLNNHLRKIGNTKGRVDLISSHLELINVDLELSAEYGGASDRTIRNNFLKLFTRLKKGINLLEKNYDYILIDCPPNFNIVTQNAIVASDYYIVPAKPDYLSTLGIDQLLAHIDKLKTKYNRYISELNEDRLGYEEIDPKLLGIVINMITVYSGEPISPQKDYIGRLVRRNELRVFSNYIRNNNSVYSDAHEIGIPVVLTCDDDLKNETHREVRKELENIGDEILQHLEELR